MDVTPLFHVCVCVYGCNATCLRVCVCVYGCNATFSRLCVCLWVQRHFQQYFNYIFCLPVIVRIYIYSSNLAHSEVRSMQHYVIKCVSDYMQVVVFSWYSDFLLQ